MKDKICKQIILTLAIVLPSMPLMAHPLLFEAASVTSGLFHPLSGMDHMLAMLAIGLWASQTGGRSVWQAPLLFLAVLLLGAVLAVNGLALPLLELMLAMSVLMLGVLILVQAQGFNLLITVLIAAFALYHGYAHGAETAALLSVGYVFGFMLGSLMLHLLGIAMAMILRRVGHRVIRVSGAALSMAGLYLLMGL